MPLFKHFSDDGALTGAAIIGRRRSDGFSTVKKTIAPHATDASCLYLTWSFLNRKAWSRTVVGNHYRQSFPGCLTAAEKINFHRSRSWAEDARFRRCASRQQLSRSGQRGSVVQQFRAAFADRRSSIADGHLMGWEGVMTVSDRVKEAVRMYGIRGGHAVSLRSVGSTMRDVEFNYATKANGLMNFRAALPLSKLRKFSRRPLPMVRWAARNEVLIANGSCRATPSFLKDNWPQVKKVPPSPGLQQVGWDGNQDGGMEGEQSNTMDVSLLRDRIRRCSSGGPEFRSRREMSKAMQDKLFEKEVPRSVCQRPSLTDVNLSTENSWWAEDHRSGRSCISRPERSEGEDPDYQRLWKGCLVGSARGNIWRISADWATGQPGSIWKNDDAERDEITT